VSTTEGKDFHRHLKITAPSFDEASGINSLVWEITASRTKDLAEAWTCTPPTDCQSPIRQLALAVISKAGFGFEEHTTHSARNCGSGKPTANNRMTFERAMNETVNYLIVIMLFPRWCLAKIGLGAASAAHQELGAYFHEFVSEEQSKVLSMEQEGLPQVKGNLLNTLVRETMNGCQPGYSVKESISLSEEELLGNMFIFLLGGHETTAHTMVYGLLLLALYPEVQESIHSELSDINVNPSNNDKDDYTSYYDRLPRTHGFIVSEQNSFKRRSE
jgi:cytochrome P450